MKVLKTTGNFMLVCPQSRVVFDPETPTEVENLTSFMKERIKSGNLVEVTEAPAAKTEIAAVGKDVARAEQHQKPAPAAKKHGK